jgi:hypothetical protein
MWSTKLLAWPRGATLLKNKRNRSARRCGRGYIGKQFVSRTQATHLGGAIRPALEPRAMSFAHALSLRYLCK